MKKRKDKSTRKTFAGIMRYLKPYSFFIVFTMFTALVQVASTLAIPYLAGVAINYMVYMDGVFAWEEIYKIFYGIAICIGAAALSQWLMSLSNNRIAYHVLADLRRDAFSKIERLPLKYIDDRAYGEIASVVVSDADQFTDGLLMGFTQLFTGIVTILGVLVILFLMRWEIALVVLLVTPLSLFTAKFIASRTYKMFKKQSEVRAEQTAFIDEMIGNLKTVKAYTHEDENEEKFKEINKRYEKYSLKAIFFSSTTNPVTRFINSLVYAAVALTGGFLVISTGGFLVGNLASCLSYVNQYTKPFNEITEVFAEFQNALACAARLFALIREESEPSDEGAEEFGRAEGNVVLNDVEFSYDPERPLIENLNLDVSAGKKIAIVGPTGCGKTTIINLLMRFYEVRGGSISLDGRDIRSIKRKSLRSNYGMVLQETWLKKGTVRENLLLGCPEATEEEMINAARLAKAHSFIMRLPKGYDTVIGGDGMISEGQKQLLCIARIMLCRPPVVILDEATSNIDTRTEIKVQAAFDELMKGRTCFVVAHRLSTIENADSILVMNAGHIVEQGTHKELLEKGGFYSDLWKAQFALSE